MKKTHNYPFKTPRFALVFEFPIRLPLKLRSYSIQFLQRPMACLLQFSHSGSPGGHQDASAVPEVIDDLPEVRFERYARLRQC